jgi:hypothetical protein
MSDYKILTMEEFEDWKLKEDYEVAKRSFNMLKDLYNNPSSCFNWTDTQAIEKAYFKQENKLMKLKSKCIRKGLVSLQD